MLTGRISSMLNSDASPETSFLVAVTLTDDHSTSWFALKAKLDSGDR